mmetsp:Transcript_8339/g.19722  ORF Transcript_8339/g.19722 Transcript_8339/m.19722 type:complete len:335 (-) Transcript_8339:4756-5760(-)
MRQGRRQHRPERLPPTRREALRRPRAEGRHPVDDGMLRRRQDDDRHGPGGDARAEVRQARLPPRRGQPPHRPQPRPVLLGGRPGRIRPPHRRAVHPLRRCGRHHSRGPHLPLPRRPRPRPQAPRGPGHPLLRDLPRRPRRRAQEARSQGPVRPRRGRGAQALHLHRRPVRGAPQPRDHPQDARAHHRAERRHPLPPPGAGWRPGGGAQGQPPRPPQPRRRRDDRSARSRRAQVRAHGRGGDSAQGPHHRRRSQLAAGHRRGLGRPPQGIHAGGYPPRDHPLQLHPGRPLQPHRQCPPSRDADRLCQLRRSSGPSACQHVGPHHPVLFLVHQGGH